MTLEVEIRAGKLKKRPARAELTPEFCFWAGSKMITQETIGDLFGISQPAISQRFSNHKDLREAWQAGRAMAKASLQQAQFRNAVEKDNVVAQIWLGKQYLDQRDSVHQVEQNTNVEIRYVAEWGGGALPPPEEDETLLIEGEAEEDGEADE